MSFCFHINACRTFGSHNMVTFRTYVDAGHYGRMLWKHYKALLGLSGGYLRAFHGSVALHTNYGYVIDRFISFKPYISYIPNIYKNLV